MAMPQVSQLSDSALLQLYGHIKTNLMFNQIFPKLTKPAPEVLELVRQISSEISDRGLDRGYESADND